MLVQVGLTCHDLLPVVSGVWVRQSVRFGLWEDAVVQANEFGCLTDFAGEMDVSGGTADYPLNSAGMSPALA